ncbi:MAG: DUF3987 domain-containing protein [Cyanobium sp. D14.bin.5]|nr:DUF3987 domain-containing protein [Cyanobium sp. D14.bin.5]
MAEALRMLKTLGLTPQEVHYRGIHWDKSLSPESKRASHVYPTPQHRGAQLKHLQQEGYRLYLLPNGGPNDADVTACRFVFAEWDWLDRQELEQRLAGFIATGLPSWTLKLETWAEGSIHLHWRLAKPVEPGRWRGLMKRLVKVLGSDPTCCNPSRLMRLAGSAYLVKTDMAKGSGGRWRGGAVIGQARILEVNPESITTIESLEAWVTEEEGRRPDLAPAPPAAPLLVVPAPTCNGYAPPRTFEELERLLAAYPTIHADSGQRDEALRLVAGLARCMEAIGLGKSDAIRLASQYHPQAADTFEQIERWQFQQFDAGSFVKQCKAAGVDVKRRDLHRPVLQPPADGLFMPQELPPGVGGQNGHVAALWGQPWAQDDPQEEEDAAADDAARLAEIASFRDAESSAVLVTPRLLFPPGLADKISQYADEQQLAVKGFYLPIQCAVASVIGNRVVAVPELGCELKGIGVLWGMNVAPVSGGKSPTSKPTVQSALLPWHIEEREKNADEMREWKRGHDKAKAAADQIARGTIVGGDDDDPLGTYLADNPQPERRHILSTDCTFERLEIIVSSGSTPGVLIFHDELGRWFSQLTRTTSQSDREKWLGLYPGSPVLTERCGREEVVVANPAVSLFGNLQPARMAGLWAADQKLNEGVADADGLWSRFLFMNLPEWNYTYRKTTVKLAPVLEKIYRQVDLAVAALPLQGDAAYEIPLAADALEMFRQWTATLLEMRKARQHEEDKGFIEKQRGNTLRLAMVLHAIDCASREVPLKQPISLAILRAAIAEACLFIVERDQLLGAIRGGDAGSIKRLLGKGKEWRAQHGAAPVPVDVIRRWGLPERESKAPAIRQWLQQVVASTPGCGSIQKKGRSLVWVPPGDSE